MAFPPLDRTLSHLTGRYPYDPDGHVAHSYEGYNDLMRDEQDDRWAAASLRIASETVTIEEISAVLKRVPSQSWTQGMPSRVSDPGATMRTRNVWILESELDSEEPFVEHLVTLLLDVESRRSQLRWLSNRCTIDLFLGYSPGDVPGEVTINHALIKRLVNLSLDLTFDLMPPVEDAATGNIPSLVSVMRENAVMTRDLQNDRKPGTVTPQSKWSEGVIVIESATLSTAEMKSLLAGGSKTTEDTSHNGYSRLANPLRLLRSNGRTVSWAMTSGAPLSAKLEEHVRALLDMVEVCADAFVRLAEHASIRLKLSFASEWGQGSLVLDQNTVERLAALPVDLTVELTSPSMFSATSVRQQEV